MTSTDPTPADATHSRSELVEPDKTGHNGGEEMITLRLTRAQAWMVHESVIGEWDAMTTQDKGYTKTGTRRPRGWRKNLKALDEALTVIEQAMRLAGTETDGARPGGDCAE